MLKKKKVVSDEDGGFKTRLDKTRKRFEETASDSKYFKPRGGKNFIRVLPPWGPGADGTFFYAGALHYKFKIGGRDRAIPCTAFSGKGPCAICTLCDKLKAHGEEDYKKLAQEIRMSKKFWVNIVARDKMGKAEPDARIQIYGGNQKFINSILEAFDEEDYGDVTDPIEGHDLILTKKGEGMASRYSATVRPRPTPLALPGWKKHIHKLDEVVLEWMSEGEIMEAIAKNYGEEAVEVGFSLKRAKKKQVEEVDDEEEDEEDEDDEPKKKKLKLVKKKVKPTREEDEEDGDSDDDEDENEE